MSGLYIGGALAQARSHALSRMILDDSQPYSRSLARPPNGPRLGQENALTGACSQGTVPG
jgi:hypothetical protein